MNYPEKNGSIATAFAPFHTATHAEGESHALA
jgi:hypothetical protein